MKKLRTGKTEALSETSPRLKVLCDPENPTVDVIAVPGIGANPNTTWTYKGDERNVDWLQAENMLPAAAPRARILRFAYESQWIGAHSVIQRTSSVADQLLHAIKWKRRDCSDRPIVFVAHCYGGIVIEHAIVKAKQNARREEGSTDVIDCIAGIIFLGTPFKGSKSQQYGKQIGQTLSMVGWADPRILEDIKPGSQFLMDLLSSFTSVVNIQAIPIFCFYEQRPTDLSRIFGLRFGLNLVVVDETSATIDGCDKFGLGKDHFAINKFPSPDDANYNSVIVELQSMIEGAPIKIRARLNPRFLDSRSRDDVFDISISRNEIDFLIAFCPSNPLDEILDQRRPAVEPYPFLFADPALTNWLNKEDDAYLWIFNRSEGSRCPLAASLTHTLASRVRRSSKKRTLVFLPSDSQTPSKTTAVFVLRCLIRQILWQRMDSVRPVIAEWGKRPEDLFARPDALQVLWTTFENILADSNLVTAYLIFDFPINSDIASLDEIFPLMKSRAAKSCRIKCVTISGHEATYKKHFNKCAHIDTRCMSKPNGVIEFDSDRTLSRLSSRSSMSLSVQPAPGRQNHRANLESLSEITQPQANSEVILDTLGPANTLHSNYTPGVAHTPVPAAPPQHSASLPRSAGYHPPWTPLGPLVLSFYDTILDEQATIPAFPDTEGTSQTPRNSLAIRSQPRSSSLPMESHSKSRPQRSTAPNTWDLARLESRTSKNGQNVLIQTQANCRIELLPETPSGHVTIEGKACIDNRPFMRVKIPLNAIPIPHTETSLRQNTVSFLEDQNGTICHDHGNELCRLSPYYYFHDQTDFKAFQTSIIRLQFSNCRLQFLKEVKLVESNRDKESTGQDLRVWMDSDNPGDCFMMFYSNARKKHKKDYYMELTTSFEPIEESQISSSKKILKLILRGKSVTDKSSSTSLQSQSGAFGAYPSGKRLEWLKIEFLSTTDKELFLKIWPKQLAK